MWQQRRFFCSPQLRPGPLQGPQGVEQSIACWAARCSRRRPSGRTCLAQNRIAPHRALRNTCSQAHMASALPSLLSRMSCDGANPMPAREIACGAWSGCKNTTRLCADNFRHDETAAGSSSKQSSCRSRSMVRAEQAVDRVSFQTRVRERTIHMLSVRRSLHVHGSRPEVHLQSEESQQRSAPTFLRCVLDEVTPATDFFV